MPATSASASEAMTSGATSGNVDDTSTNTDTNPDTNPDTNTTVPVDSSSSGEPGEGTSSGSTGPAESSSSGAPPEDPTYPACMQESDPACPEPYDHCYESLPPEYTVCSVICMDDAECPQPTSGDAAAVCAGPSDNECVLDCAGGATCPDGMECVEVGGGMFMRCGWPV